MQTSTGCLRAVSFSSLIASTRSPQSRARSRMLMLGARGSLPRLCSQASASRMLAAWTHDVSCFFVSVKIHHLSPAVKPLYTSTPSFCRRSHLRPKAFFIRVQSFAIISKRPSSPKVLPEPKGGTEVRPTLVFTEGYLIDDGKRRWFVFKHPYKFPFICTKSLKPSS